VPAWWRRRAVSGVVQHGLPCHARLHRPTALKIKVSSDFHRSLVMQCCLGEAPLHRFFVFLTR
jgi:hypothetical protein